MSKMSNFVVVFVVICAVVKQTVDAVDFTDCGSGTVRQILIDGCDEAASAAQCFVARGQPVSFRALFVPDSNYASVEADVEARIGFLPPLRAEDKNACNTFGLSCPLVPQTPYWINTTLTIPGLLPRLRNIKVTVKLTTPTGNNRSPQVIACGRAVLNLK